MNKNKAANKSPAVGAKLNRSASGRRISFDDNIQLIEGKEKVGGEFSGSFTNKPPAISDDFIIGLEKEIIIILLHSAMILKRVNRLCIIKYF